MHNREEPPFPLHLCNTTNTHVYVYIPSPSQVSHEFALNGNPQNPYCAGIAGVVQAYHSALQSVSLYGPTNFAPIINHVARFAEQAAANPQNQVCTLHYVQFSCVDINLYNDCIQNNNVCLMA